MTEPPADAEVQPLDSDPRATAGDEPVPGQAVRKFRLSGAKGTDGRTEWEIDRPRCSIGQSPGNDVLLGDPTVSRFHCEIALGPQGALVRDLESRNGTFVDGVRVREAWLRDGSELRLGRSALRFELGGEGPATPLSGRTELGPLVGRSRAMREVFALLEKVAGADLGVLIEGETGTGKEGAAEVLHLLSPRRDRPLVVVDCAAMPPGLMESELFGHEKGSFTGATARRAGAFEAAQGGTLFLDEIGELPLDLQPKLLRVLERRELRPVGSNALVPLDVRVVAATHRDLRAAVNRHTFRADLWFRLSVVQVALPPLRERPEDLPLLVARLLERRGASAQVRARLTEPAFLAALARASWPGNVRELRNYLDRCVVFEQPLPLEGQEAQGGPFAGQRQRAIDAFERRYLEEVLGRHGGKVAAAAAEAGVGRAYLYRLMQKHRPG